MKKILFLLSLILALLVSGTVDAKKKKYPNGNYYEGKMKEGEPHGIGIMIFANGDIYKGEWYEGMCHGTGNMVYKNGNIYEGQWQVNNAYGHGIMKYANGNIYEGSWIEGLQNGYGTMRYSNGNTYIGNWLRGKCHQGKLTTNDNSWFDGEWLYDIFYTGTCKGEINGCFYEGTWEDGCFVNGVCNGNIFSSFQFNGEIRDKTYYNGTGKGEINGNYYEGKWIDGKFIGECRIKATKEHPVFCGKILADGTMDGKIEFNNDVTYEGTLSNSFVPSGKGVLSFQYEKRGSCLLSGIWKDGKLVELNKGNVFVGTTPIAVKISDGNLFIGNSTKMPNQYNTMTHVIKKYINDIDTQLKEKRILSQLRTFRGIDYYIGKNKGMMYVWLYKFADAEYQYYTQNNKDIFHGDFHLWNGRYTPHDESREGDILYSVKGTFRHGIKQGIWTFEEIGNGRYKGHYRRLVINYKDGMIDGLCTLEGTERDPIWHINCYEKIVAYYRNHKWDKRGTKYYYKKAMKKDESPDNYWDVERNISYDNNGNLHGNIYMRENDIELRENYQHGQLIKSDKYSISRGIILSPKRGENRFKDMWKFKLPTSYFGNGFRVDSNPLIGLSYFDLTAESEYNEERISREMEKHNKE